MSIVYTASNVKKRESALSQVLFRDPGMDTERSWIFPRVLKFLYFATIFLTLICSAACLIIGIIGILRDDFFGSTEKFLIVCGSIVIFPIAVFCLLIGNRIVYEWAILKFRIFQALREAVDGLASVNKSLVGISKVQQTAGQYVCDMLATINDSLGGL